MSWREMASGVIAKVIQDVGTENPAAIRKAISAAYPFGPREHWPYKVWLSEVQRQLNPATARRTEPEPEPDGPLMAMMEAP